jgi:predicted amidohydrolase
MKVTIHQIAPKLLDLKANLETVIQGIEQAKKGGADLVVFPELALTGYFVGERYHEAALRLDSEEVKRLAKASRGTAAVLGFIEESPAMNFYNSALVVAGGKVVASCRKLNLPNYGSFEERKIFSPGNRVNVFRRNGFTIAVLVCNDMWHPSLPYLAVTQEADMIVTLINSSQGAMGHDFDNIETWSLINTFYARIFGIYVVCANRCGKERYMVQAGTLNEELAEQQAPLEDSSSFWGGSEIINPFGIRIAKAALQEPDVIHGMIERELLRRKRILLPYLRQDDPYFSLRELKRILAEKEADPSV